MKKLTKIMALVLAAVFVFACFAGCSAKEEAKETLTLATSADFPPYESIGDDGSYVGIDIEIAQAIADGTFNIA